MFSAAVDAAWHRLLDSSDYEAFCTVAAGRVLGHHADRGHGPVAWAGAYEEAYGPLPEIWFTDEDGILDTVALARYREDGTVTASWLCSPAGGGDDGAPVPTEHALHPPRPDLLDHPPPRPRHTACSARRPRGS
ncbi:hypothetical protein [Kitasatospora herbaricolor]|uniref:SnoaL-like domain-containing protein n=1 Tax=Kitasatospora herbaricolor TaxID=68217 RepID=A0ABZ1W0M5_9ACTN|nr:hypothetical protein [Kitasatospora herbaricolor]